MQFRIKARDVATTRQVEQVLQFYLIGIDGQVDHLEIAVETIRDTLDNFLYRCSVVATLHRGGTLELEETQGDLILAVNRVLDRSVRTLRRRGPAGPMVRSA